MHLFLLYVFLLYTYSLLTTLVLVIPAKARLFISTVRKYRTTGPYFADVWNLVELSVIMGAAIFEFYSAK